MHTQKETIYDQLAPHRRINRGQLLVHEAQLPFFPSFFYRKKTPNMFDWEDVVVDTGEKLSLPFDFVILSLSPPSPPLHLPFPLLGS